MENIQRERRLVDGAPYVVVTITEGRLTWEGFTDRIEALRASRTHHSVAILQGPVLLAEFTQEELAEGLLPDPTIQIQKGSPASGR